MQNKEERRKRDRDWGARDERKPRGSKGKKLRKELGVEKESWTGRVLETLFWQSCNSGFIVLYS